MFSQLSNNIRVHVNCSTTTTKKKTDKLQLIMYDIFYLSLVNFWDKNNHRSAIKVENCLCTQTCIFQPANCFSNDHNLLFRRAHIHNELKWLLKSENVGPRVWVCVCLSQMKGGQSIILRNSWCFNTTKAPFSHYNYDNRIPITTISLLHQQKTLSIVQLALTVQWGENL